VRSDARRFCALGQEKQKFIWRRINRAIDKPSLGAIPFVQQIKEGEVVDVLDIEAMDQEIRMAMEQWFDLSMSISISICHSGQDWVHFLTKTLPSVFKLGRSTFCGILIT
jgi:hypothetical protein